MAERVGESLAYEDEFEVGCVLEHAGYHLSWLLAFFGPVKSVVPYAACLMPAKVHGMPSDRLGPDFAVACLEFVSGVTARLTCSTIGPEDYSLSIVGDAGILTTKECWNYGAPVYILRRMKDPVKSRLFGAPDGSVGGLEEYPLVRKPSFQCSQKTSNRMDFARGIAELADSIFTGRTCRLASGYVLHLNEVALAIHLSKNDGTAVAIESRFDPPEPMPWATL